MNTVILGIAAAFLALPLTANAAPSEDLICYSASSDMRKYMSFDEYQKAMNGMESFFLGRLSVIEPSTEWQWVAGSEKHLTPEQAVPVLKKCAERYSQLTHLSAQK